MPGLPIDGRRKAPGERLHAGPLTVLVAVLVLAAPSHAQYRLDQWTTENGLPQNSVREILQTRDGYLWLTTFDGLVRFDGVRFTVYQKGNTPGIQSSRFYSLYEDRSGDLWAGQESGDVVRRHQGRFTTYSRAHGLLRDQPVFLSGDARGDVVAYYQAYSQDQIGNVTRLSVRAFRRAGDRFQETTELGVTLDGLRVRPVDGPAVHRIVDGDLWIATPHRLTRYARGAMSQSFELPVASPGTANHVVGGSHDHIELATLDPTGGLFVTRPGGGPRELLSAHPPEGLAGWFAYRDSEGNYWFGGNAGLIRARRSTWTSFGKANGFGFAETYPLLESRSGALWIGTASQGLFRLENGSVTHPITEAVEGFAPELGGVTSLYEDRAGELWVNGFGRLRGGRLVREPWPVDVLPRLAVVWAMYDDDDGTRWRGTSMGVVRSQGGTTRRFTTKDGLAGDDTKVIVGDGRGGLWLGSTGGLTHYENGVFRAFTEKDGLPGNTVRALKQDPDGTLWIGTYDSGLGRLKDGRFTRYTTRDGLFDDGVFQILEDDAGWFWMSSNRGVHRARKRELDAFAEGRIRTITSIAYNKSDGMPSTECNGGRWPAGVKGHDGRLWFPTARGVAMIDPAAVKADPRPPPVVIEGMRIDNQAVPPDEWESATNPPTGPRSAIRILPGQETFEIDYTALSFVNSENLRFRFRLEGVDHGWVEAGTRRTAYYARVPPGTFTFRVLAANSLGVWNRAGATLAVTVVPPVWQTAWFRALSALALAGVVAGAFRYRVAQLRNVQRAQQHFARQLIQSQEHERKRIAAELHDSLGQSLLIVRNRAQIGQVATRDPELLSQLASIAATAAESLDEVRGIAQNLRPYHLDRLGLTKALEVMIDNVAATAKTRVRSELVPLDDLFGKEDAITLYRIVQEGLNNVLKHAGATEAFVGVERLTGSVTLTIRDDGRGFTPEESMGTGFGMAGMAERVRMLGGQLRLDSQPGRGTTVTVRLTLPVRGDLPGAAA